MQLLLPLKRNPIYTLKYFSLPSVLKQWIRQEGSLLSVQTVFIS